MPEKLSESVGEVIQVYTWIVVDAFILFLLLASVLGYKDFDDPMRVFIRGVFVAFWGYVWLSGLHILIYVRRQGGRMPGSISYTMFALKLGLIIGTGYWAYQRGLF